MIFYLKLQDFSKFHLPNLKSIMLKSGVVMEESIIVLPKGSFFSLQFLIVFNPNGSIIWQSAHCSFFMMKLMFLLVDI
jgi:hypothetical protein